MSKSRPWQVGFGPFLNVPPGETRKIDAQPKCRFTSEKIYSTGDHEDVHLLAIYVGKEEQLKLNGDSISFSKFSGCDKEDPKPLVLSPDFRVCDPALPIEIEFQNRSKEPRTVSLSILGTTIL